MGRKSVKDNKNIYQQVREDADLTRDEAESLLEYISSDRIEKIESDKSAPHPDEVLRMAECYKRPELPNYYCSHECPIGMKYVPEIDDKALSQITIEVLDGLNNLERIKNRLIEISLDGKIDEDEKKDFAKIKESLNSLKATIDSLSLWVEKQNIKE